MDINGPLKSRVEEYAEMGSPTVAVGLSSPDHEVLKSLRRSREHADLRVVAPNSIELPNGHFQVVYADNPENEITRMLAEDKVDGIVRGTIDSVKTYDAYRKITGESYTVVPSVMEYPSGRQFFVTLISDLKGWSKKSRYENTLSTAKFMKEWDLPSKVAIFPAQGEKYLRKKDWGEKYLTY